MKALSTDQHFTYQLQYRKCGKSNCKTCREGKGHGPYWYAYWRHPENIYKLRCAYVGKTMPSTADVTSNG